MVHHLPTVRLCKVPPPLTWRWHFHLLYQSINMKRVILVTEVREEQVRQTLQNLSLTKYTWVLKCVYTTVHIYYLYANIGEHWCLKGHCFLLSFFFFCSLFFFLLWFSFPLYFSTFAFLVLDFRLCFFLFIFPTFSVSSVCFSLFGFLSFSPYPLLPKFFSLPPPVY